MDDLLFRKIREKLVAGFSRIKVSKYKIKLNNWKSLVAIGSVLTLIIITSVVIVFYNTIEREDTLVIDSTIESTAFKVVFGGNEVGVVTDKQRVYEILLNIQIESPQRNGLQIAYNEEVIFEVVNLDAYEITPYEVIKDRIINSLTNNVYAYAININGEDFAFVETKEMAELLLEEIKNPYLELVNNSGSTISQIEILEDVEVIKKETCLSSIKDHDTVLALLQKGTTEEKIHIVQKGESYWTIAHNNNLTVEELKDANPGKNEKLIYPGDEINLIVPKPYLTVATVEEKTYIKKTPFGKEVEYTSSLYKDQRQVKKKGVYGEVEVLAKVKKLNGVEVEEEILNEVVLSQPVAQIELQGTKPLPPLQGTGIFMSPTRGTLTSRFGMRWGRMHNGIDIAARTGTPIKAADGGVVTYAGWKGNYGLLVEIDHGGGWKTRYGHCSKIYVKVGDKVYKDKTIAAIGNTGNSTGPHVHFEVLKHGVPQNPLNYIDKKYN